MSKAIPYGVLRRVSEHRLGFSRHRHDTSAFAVQKLRRWWVTIGKARYSDASRLLICADGGGGGSNGYRIRARKIELAKFAADTGLRITACHLPREPANGTRSSTDCSPKSP